MKLQSILESGSDLSKIADAIKAKQPGWKVTTTDLAGKRGESPRIIFSDKSKRAKVAFENGEYVFSFEVKGKGWGTMWRKAASSSTAAGLIAEIDKSLKDEAQALRDTLDSKAEGADEVEHDGKTYRRTGPKTSASQPGEWKLWR